MSASKKSPAVPMMEAVEQQVTRTETCDEVRSTRLHYRLRCLLHPDHEGEHRWTPELLPHDADEFATG